jgi:hypothetical protein
MAKADKITKQKIDSPARRIEIELGDTKQPDVFYPQFKTKHWDNECNFSLRLNDADHAGGTVRTNQNKVEWERAGRIARMYEVDGAEDGGFEFEVELAEKPATNILEFTIQSKEFDFFYQPELTQDEIDRHAVRPENVVGSYAVYHKSKKGNYNGGKEYRAGKAFHIFRPHAIDANGVKEWCDLNIDESTALLKITIPQKFLDEAKYPIIVDPTIGYTTAPASYAEHGVSCRISTDYSPASNGNVVSISIYFGAATTSAIWRPVLYTGTPGGGYALVTYGGTASAATGTFAVKAVTGAAVATGSVYGQGIWFSNTQDLAYDAGTHTLRRQSPAWNETAAPPNPFAQVSTIANAEYGMYATYNASGTPTGTTYTQECTATLTLVDSVFKSESRILSEALVLSAVGVKAIQRTLIDPLVLADNLSKSISRTISDVVTLTDSVFKAIGRTLTEVVALADTITRSISRTISETVTLVDSAIKSVARTLTETITLADTLESLKAIFKTLTETITLNDTLGRRIERVFTEAVTITDTISKSISRTFSEVITLVSSAVGSLPTIIVRTIGHFTIHSLYGLMRTINDKTKSFILHQKGRDKTLDI